VDSIVILIAVGALSALFTALLVPDNWDGGVVIAAASVLTSVVIVAGRRHAHSIKLMQEEYSRDLSGRLTHIEKTTWANELRLRSIAQEIKGGIADVQAHDVHLASLMKQGADNEKRLRQLGQMLKADIERNIGRDEVLVKLTKSASDNEVRLRQIGQLVKGDSKVSGYVPLALRHPMVGGDSAGRIAAAVGADPMRASRLLGALAEGSSASATHTRRRIGIFGTSALHDELAATAEICQYLPSVSTAQHAAFRPSVILVEELACREGVWAGALSASGIALYDEMCQVIESAKHSECSVYFVRNVGVSDVNTNDLIGRAHVVTPISSFDEEWSDGVRLRFMESVKQYCVTSMGGKQ